MDSGNSGSIQSSSGGSEEYDSRADSISAFLTGGNHGPPSQQHAAFDSVSNYFDSLSRSPNPSSLLNLDMVWPRGLRSDPNCTDLTGLLSSPLQPQPFLTNQSQQAGRANFYPSQLPQPPEHSTSRATVSGSVPGSVSVTADQTANSNNPVRPKKRSRASRRQPTTVLTTDTTNFRAMVQEFTGIPSPPFAASPFQRSRLDLFGTASPALRSAHLESSVPPYLLRPFPQKFHPQPFLSPPAPPSSSTLIADAVASTSNNNTNNTMVTSTSVNFQIPSDLAVLKQPQNVLNMQNPILNLQSLLQASPKFPLQNEFGLGHGGQVAFGLTEAVPADGGALQSNEGTNTQSWAEGASTEQGLLRYNNSQQGLTNGKVNSLSAVASSDFRGDNKGPENVAAAAAGAASRTEGLVEQWISPSNLKNI